MEWFQVMITMERMAAGSSLYLWMADKGLGSRPDKPGPNGVCSEYEKSIFIEAHIRGQMDERKRVRETVNAKPMAPITIKKYR